MEAPNRAEGAQPLSRSTDAQPPQHRVTRRRLSLPKTELWIVTARSPRLQPSVERLSASRLGVRRRPRGGTVTPRTVSPWRMRRISGGLFARCGPWQFSGLVVSTTSATLPQPRDPDCSCCGR